MELKGQNQPQRQTAKEVIAANVKALIEQLEAGHKAKAAKNSEPKPHTKAAKKSIAA